MTQVGFVRPKLTIDVGPLLDDFWTGIPVFTRRLIRALQISDALDLDYVHDLVRLPGAEVQATLNRGNGASLRAAFEYAARDVENRADVEAPLLYPTHKPLRTHLNREASTVHDLSTLVMPENHMPSNVSAHLASFARELETDEVVFCISEATRAALATAMPSTAAKSRLLYQYVDWPEEFRWLERNAPKMKIGRYAVAIGTVEPRKNLGLLLRAMATPAVEKSNLDFLIVGRNGWGSESYLERLPPHQRSRVKFTGFVTEFVKYRLIANAEFLVLPSIYEGFGIPALEAMSLGKPVLAARTSSLPEVVGEAGLLFDPFDLEDFCGALLEISHPARLAALAPLALAQNAHFTPARMAAPVVQWASE